MAVIKKESHQTWIGTAAEMALFTSMLAGDKFITTDTKLEYEYTGAAWIIKSTGVQLSGSKTPDYTIPVFDVTAWSGFTNQPANDGVEVVSDSASDTQKITIFGTTVTTGVFCYETIILTGATAVATTKTNWGNIVGAFLGDINGQNVVPAVGTITIREASADQTITTIAAGKISKGLVAFDLDDEDISAIVVSGNVYAKQFAVGATTLVTTANGALLNLTAGNILDCTPKTSNLIGFISDASAATMQIIVWE